MYSTKLFLSMILSCLNVCGPSQSMLHPANLGATAGNTQEVSSSSAISSELRAMAAKGQLGNNLGSSGYREQIKRLYEAANFAPLWINSDQPTSQATSLIEILRASRLKGLNPSDYDAESLATKSRSLKGHPLSLKPHSMQLLPNRRCGIFRTCGSDESIPSI